MKALTLFLLLGALAMAETEFHAVRKKPFWFDQKGIVRIDESAITFAPAGPEDKLRSWRYEDIQHLDRVSPTAFILLTYEDVAWKLGRDRSYHFELTSGEFSDELFDQVSARIGKPATDRVVEPPRNAQREFPAKRLTTFGGSEGTLYFSPERIVYASEARKSSREWLLDRDVESVWSTDPYRFEVHAYEGNPGALRKPEVYKFALKRPLDAEFYRRLKLQVYNSNRERTLSPEDSAP